MVLYVELTKLPVPLDLRKFLYAPPDSSARDSRESNALILGMRLVTLCYIQDL